MNPSARPFAIVGGVKFRDRFGDRAGGTLNIFHSRRASLDLLHQFIGGASRNISRSLTTSSLTAPAIFTPLYFLNVLFEGTFLTLVCVRFRRPRPPTRSCLKIARIAEHETAETKLRGFHLIFLDALTTTSLCCQNQF